MRQPRGGAGGGSRRSSSRRPSGSRTGLGVGFYHAAKQAAEVGYRLTLAANEQGIVCFALARAEGGKAAG